MSFRSDSSSRDDSDRGQRNDRGRRSPPSHRRDEGRHRFLPNNDDNGGRFNKRQRRNEPEEDLSQYTFGKTDETEERKKQNVDGTISLDIYSSKKN
jgi:hypothetical protein